MTFLYFFSFLRDVERKNGVVRDRPYKYQIGPFNVRKFIYDKDCSETDFHNIDRNKTHIFYIMQPFNI